MNNLENKKEKNVILFFPKFHWIQTVYISKYSRSILLLNKEFLFEKSKWVHKEFLFILCRLNIPINIPISRIMNLIHFHFFSFYYYNFSKKLEGWIYRWDIQSNVTERKNLSNMYVIVVETSSFIRLALYHVLTFCIYEKRINWVRNRFKLCCKIFMNVHLKKSYISTCTMSFQI